MQKTDPRVQLDYANQIRCERAHLRRRVKSGQVSLYALLREPPKAIETLPLFKLLTWQHLMGTKRARSIIFEAGGIYDERIPVGKMSKAARERIMDQMRVGANGVGSIKE